MFILVDSKFVKFIIVKQYCSLILRYRYIYANPTKTGGELRCSGRIGSSCSLVTIPVISHEWERDWKVFTTSGTYTWSFVTQMFSNCEPSDDFNLTNRNPWFSSFLVSSNPLLRRSWQEPQALDYRINWEIYTPYTDAAGMLLHINGKFTMRKLKSSFLRCRPRYKVEISVPVVSFISNSMNRCDQQNHQNYNYLVKGRHLYNGTWN